MKRFWERNGIWVLLSLVVVAVALCLLSYLSTTSSFLSNAAGIVTKPFRTAFTAVEQWVEDKQKYYADYTALEEENRVLREKIAEMEEAVRQSQSDSEENALFRELIGLREQRRDFVFESASIIERSSSNWTSSFTLGRGTAHGVAVGNCVVSAEGYLVGVVSEVGYNWCTVLTVLDTDTQLGALVFRTGEIAVAGGDFTLMKEGRLKLNYIGTASQLLIGDRIVTSGLGGVYPSGLVIASVEQVQTDDSGLTQYAVLKPMTDIDTLTEVFIIKSFDIVE